MNDAISCYPGRDFRHRREQSGKTSGFLFRLKTLRFKALVVLCLICLLPQQSSAYSVLTHEQLIDLAWTDSIRPLLLSRYPHTTAAQLREAHAYAYGGCVIQDIGYYPFGHQFFSNLTHYVRTGEFVSNLFRDARNVNELAFAIGALSHYIGDDLGHQDAVNISVPIEFPDLRKKFGGVVTYDENPHAHVRTEFAFDVDQLSYHRFPPAAYLASVGLAVPTRLLERAFFATYGLRLHDVLGNEFAAVRSYRYSVRRLIPKVAYAELLLHKKDFPGDSKSPDFRRFESQLKQASVENGWAKFKRKKAGISTHLLAILIAILPKIGPLSDLAIRGPNPQTEEDYVRSVNRASARYETVLHQLASNPKSTPAIDDLDLDTGYPVRPGGYPLTDQTYAKLLDRITKKPKQPVPAGLRKNILAYYANPTASITTKKNHKAWQKVQKDLTILQQMQ